MTPMKKPLSRSLLGAITLALTATAGAHSGHAPTEVHSHLGSPVIWLLLGAGVLGVAAVALLASDVDALQGVELTDTNGP
ncbi:hypothetical protein [Vreelandella massiliensis]|uniref:hypothetical protein n=1 Tax=Vreelandella massiliensis TaxID=1816686 RepID=UPI001B301583|nr:hypothetical protein [Halomonas massiliensis]